ncbi:MAG TPA: NF038122 family metalloprotease, partial [Pyrinomonadaceae bacterium]|nr:NF038122 family metalloprotease [Pyrinomonadaceae bacterium]
MVLAFSLAAMLLLPSFGLVVSAHAPATADSDYDHFIIYAGEDSDTVCREANASERSELEKISPKNLRQFNHLGEKSMGLNADVDNDVTHLTIILRATPNLENNAPAKAAFTRAAAAWENLVNSPVTIYIDADFGPDNFGAPWPSGVLGSTSSPSLSGQSYSVVRSNLITGANTPAKQAVYNALPASSLPTDVGNLTAVSVSSSIARAIGLLPATAQPGDNAARMGFNGSGTFTFDFDRTDGISGIDFESVAAHEIGHALGFTSRSGSQGTTTAAMWDLYRFRSGTTSATFTTAQRIMTAGGPVNDPLQFYFVPGESQLGLSNGGPSGSTDNNADGNQSSHWKQASLNGGYIGIMDPRIPGGVVRPITSNDVNALNIFGYNSNAVPAPTPPANDNFSAAQTISGCSGSVNGTNVGATRESGEPNHSPDNGGGNRSIWFSWQALGSGNVTFTTAGSGFDTVMGIYTGNSVGSLSTVGKADDNSGTDKTSTVSFNATSGTVYRIAVDGYNNGGTGGDVGPVTLNWTAANCGSSVINFSQTGYNLSESAGFVQIGVVRLGDSSGPATVNYATSDTAGLQSCSVNNGAASERCDYATTVGTLRFAAGESSKSFVIPIVDDVLVEGTESFTVTLSAPSGASLGPTTQVLVTMTNDDANPNTPNPIDGVTFFITQQYIDFLGRLPDSVGLANWTATLAPCPNGGFGENLNPSCDRVHVSSGFFLSPEF